MEYRDTLVIQVWSPWDPLVLVGYIDTLYLISCLSTHAFHYKFFLQKSIFCLLKTWGEGGKKALISSFLGIKAQCDMAVWRGRLCV